MTMLTTAGMFALAIAEMGDVPSATLIVVVVLPPPEEVLVGRKRATIPPPIRPPKREQIKATAINGFKPKVFLLAFFVFCLCSFAVCANGSRRGAGSILAVSFEAVVGDIGVSGVLIGAVSRVSAALAGAACSFKIGSALGVLFCAVFNSSSDI